jgi:hypothetical protein
MYGELHVSSAHAVDAAMINPKTKPRRDETLLLFMMHLLVWLSIGRTALPQKVTAEST